MVGMTSKCCAAAREESRSAASRSVKQLQGDGSQRQRSVEIIISTSLSPRTGEQTLFPSGNACSLEGTSDRGNRCDPASPEVTHRRPWIDLKDARARRCLFLCGSIRSRHDQEGKMSGNYGLCDREVALHQHRGPEGTRPVQVHRRQHFRHGKGVGPLPHAATRMV